jgi:glutamyl-tRNA synthetase
MSDGAKIKNYFKRWNHTMTVITRFAPSPTGYLHIGGARTALFNWLFSRHHQGKYLLRIEDTDQERSTPAATQAIFESLKWLELDHDGEVVFQSKRANRHLEIAYDLLSRDKAYYCTCTPQELADMREQALTEGRQPRYDGRCREKQHTHGAIRLKMPLHGTTLIEDLVQGAIEVQNTQLDDLILVRSDQTPTYMLSVVVDDYDMNITHIIRGDDHLTNAFRQYHLYNAMEWAHPAFAHIPLIHGPDGAKLSKRHGALGVEQYQEMGYLPEAMRNYLLRLGWSHGDDEFISTDQAIKWFSLSNVGRSPARLDFKKLDHMNAHYMRLCSNTHLVTLMAPLLEKKISRAVTHEEKSILKQGMEGLKQRAKTLVELTENALFYLQKPEGPLDEKAKKLLAPEMFPLVQDVVTFLKEIDLWEEKNLEEAFRKFSEDKAISLGKIAQPLRVLLTGSTVSPSVFEIMSVLGKEASLDRLEKSSFFS